MAFTPRAIDITNYTQFPTDPPSEDNIRQDLEDAFQEVYDNVTNPLLAVADGASGMDTVGMTPIDGVMTTPQQALEYLKDRVDTTQPNLKIYSILDYGAISGGSAIINTTAIQNTLLAIGTNGVLYIPSGDYDIQDEFIIPQSVLIYGNGYSSHIKQTLVDKNIFILSDNCEVNNVRLEGYGGTTGTNFAKGNGVYSDSKKNSVVKSCYMHNFENCGVQLRDCIDYSVINNRIYGNIWGAFATSADIIVYSGTSGKRGIITNNFCSSNNSQGIYVNALGYDTEIIISNNIVTVLDSNGDEIDLIGVLSNSENRRHCIEISYNGGQESRIIVTNNICRNAVWSGIYFNNVAIEPTGTFLIANNFISYVGLSDLYFISGTLSGGILAKSSGSAGLITSNIIKDVLYAPAIHHDRVNGSTVKNVISNNAIANCLTGIVGGVYEGDLTIIGNNITASLSVSPYGNEYSDIKIVSVGATTNGGNNVIKNNFINKAIIGGGIYLETDTATRLSEISGNTIIGVDSTTNNNTNRGIYSRRNKSIIKDNRIEGFYNAVYNDDLFTGRNFLYPIIDQNFIKDCSYGIVARASSNAATFVCEGNIFENIVGKFTGDGFFSAGYEGLRRSDNYTIYKTTIPTIGTWIVGDRCIKTNPSEAGTATAKYVIDGWVCTVAGNPGTWLEQRTLTGN